MVIFNIVVAKYEVESREPLCGDVSTKRNKPFGPLFSICDYMGFGSPSFIILCYIRKSMVSQTTIPSHAETIMGVMGGIWYLGEL